VSRATVAVGGRTEAVPIVGDRTAGDTAKALLDLGVDIAVVKLGHEGVLAATRAEQVVVAPIHVEVVNGLGAGDAFGGALCHGLLSGWNLERTIRFANAAGALVASRLGCADDMPSAAEVKELLAGDG
jgi:5-dehydro-2-deoxygluconokinase